MRATRRNALPGLAVALLGAACAGAPAPGPADAGSPPGFSERLLLASGPIPGTDLTATGAKALAVGHGRVAAIAADLAPSGQALLLKQDGKPPVVVARPGSPLPGTSATFSTVVDEDPRQYTNENVYLDAAERLWFLARGADETVVGLFRAGLDGRVEKVVVPGDAAGSSTVAVLQAHLTVSPAGARVAFVARLASGKTGVFAWDQTHGVREVALEDGPLPGNATATFSAAFSDVFVNDAGDLAFSAGSHLSNHTWVWHDGGAPVVLTWATQPIPGMPGQVVAVARTEGVHADGQVLVTSTPNILLNPILLNRQRDSQVWSPVVVPGAAAPSGSTWKSVSPGDVRATASGWASCLALENVSNDVVLVRQKAGAATEVARVGAALKGTNPPAIVTSLPRHRQGDDGKTVFLAPTTNLGTTLTRVSAAGELKVVAHDLMPVEGRAPRTIKELDPSHFFVDAEGNIVFTAILDDDSTAVLSGD